MTTPIPTRFSDDEIAMIDELIASGVGDSRSAVLREALHRLVDSVRRATIGAEIAASYRALPQTADDDQLAMANAIALTEAESW